MQGFQVSLTSERFKRDLDGLLDGVMDIFKESKGLAFNRRKAGNIVVKLLVLDQLVEQFSKYCGEAGETTIADYWGAKALAYAFAGKVNEGRAYFTKSQARRTGGRFAEWNQEFYS
jgi:hypothetical protein